MDLQLQVAWGRQQAARGTELLAASWRNSSHTWLQSRLLPAGRVPLHKFSLVLELLLLPRAERSCFSWSWLVCERSLFQ